MRQGAHGSFCTLVAGDAGFIGSNFVLNWLADPSADGIVNVNKLTYAGNRKTLAAVKQDSRHVFSQMDIRDRAALDRPSARCRPHAVAHFAAESHVDRLIHDPGELTQTNTVGTFTLPEATRAHWSGFGSRVKAVFRFLYVSTDEVFGLFGPTDPQFFETTPCAPNSPYSAPKAASDHLVQAYHHTYGLPALTTDCSNNYGLYHFPEKLTLLMIINALSGKPLSVYGDGRNVRDWLYVGDHYAAIREALTRGRLGETYNVGGQNEKANLDVVYTFRDLSDELEPKATDSYRDQITFVKDRPGHDHRYAIDAHKLERELGWKSVETLETSLRKTVQWYSDNQIWVQDAVSGEYRN